MLEIENGTRRNHAKRREVSTKEDQGDKGTKKTGRWVCN
jgi:hypothetical protein